MTAGDTEPPWDPVGDARPASWDTLAAWDALVAASDGGAALLDDERAALLVRQLQHEGDVRIVDRALPLLTDPVPDRRRVAARVLHQFGYWHDRPFSGRITPALAEAARQEPDDGVRAVLVDALGSVEDPAWAAELGRHAADRHAPVRQAVASSLPLMFAGAPMDDAAVATLIGLTVDVDPGVRDWATMALGTQSDLDTPQIRDALAARLDDPGGDTALEAVLGLARRSDVRARDQLISRLGAVGQPVNSMDLDAAAALADPALVPQLQALQREWDGDEDDHAQLLRHAIARCSSEAVALAAAQESELAAATQRALAGTGWTITLVGHYPRTSVEFLRPDGTPDDPPGYPQVWDDDKAPAQFDPQFEAEQWISELERRRHG